MVFSPLQPPPLRDLSRGSPSSLPPHLIKAPSVTMPNTVRNSAQRWTNIALKMHHSIKIRTSPNFVSVTHPFDAEVAISFIRSFVLAVLTEYLLKGIVDGVADL